ncbi:fucolectin-4-like [Cheilinus undulatus]|uniref:fucolectin-4-like n=1 Tax=Cheilinus undulatus TaxID=241271 RepID=UPI001BD1BFCA|nr:fucolectin-4-like [Cheilinus undulatus]
MKNLFLFLALLLLHSACSAHENVALRGKATLSNRALDSTAAANNAIDGNRNSNFYAGSCASSILQTAPWWKVDLLESYTISQIVIVNRGDCCGERINDLEVYVDRQKVATIIAMNAGEIFIYNFNTTVDGREVTLMLPGDNRLLTVCEVEVYGHPTVTRQNVALKGKASQSSLFDYRSIASNAIDGNPDSTWESGACSCTTDMMDPWWKLDLLETHKVFSVNVTNRGDGAFRQLNGAVIHVGDSPDNMGVNNPRCAHISSIPAGETAEFQCGSGMDGRYVTINIPGETRILSMCEVEVFGYVLN